MRLISLGGFLILFWLLLSGHYTLFLNTMGVGCVLGVLWLSSRMKLIDAEGHPVHLLFRSLFYAPWLLLEIFKSGLQVTRVILSPSLPISPTMTKVRASQKTDLGANIYANSITLTPGTIAVGLNDRQITIHALQQIGADEVEDGAMDKRVSVFEGGVS